MGFFSLKWLQKVAHVAVNLLGTPAQPNSVPISSGLPFSFTQMMSSGERVIGYGGMASKEKFDAWLELADSATGSEKTAIDLFIGLPAKAEEELFDHLIDAARIYGYHLLKLPGYVI